MQTVNALFTAEERDLVRRVVQELDVSWKKQSTLGNRTFTIAVSTIGGSDVIGINPGAVGSPSNYKYFNEKDYVIDLAWERELNLPIGGLVKALAEATLDNTSGRFTPRYMGGNSELFTAILPRRPIKISAGFITGGIEQMVAQFAGILTRQPLVDVRRKRVLLEAADYVDFFQGRKVDQTTMFTDSTTDTVIEGLFSQMGMSTAQYSLDPGINVIPFGMFEAGVQFGDIINMLVQAENGHAYQDEEGKFRFENRQHWDSSPYNTVQTIITTGQVINAQAPSDDHIINLVEIKSDIMRKQPLRPIANFTVPTQVLAGSTTEVWLDYDDPVLALTTPTASGTDSYYEANVLQDGTGAVSTSSISVKSISNFARASKIVFQNNSGINLWITRIVVSGRVASKIGEVYTKQQDDSSVTAYEPRPYQLENPYIQNQSWANSLAQMLLEDFSNPENLQKITVRAIPRLQTGDLISWQGRYWRVFGIKARLDASSGFIQDLTLLQRTINQYFRIGISTIGGSHKIAP